MNSTNSVAQTERILGPRYVSYDQEFEVWMDMPIAFGLLLLIGIPNMSLFVLRRGSFLPTSPAVIRGDWLVFELCQVSKRFVYLKNQKFYELLTDSAVFCR